VGDRIVLAEEYHVRHVVDVEQVNVAGGSKNGTGSADGGEGCSAVLTGSSTS